MSENSKKLKIWQNALFLLCLLFISFFLMSSVSPSHTHGDEMENPYGKGPFPYILNEKFGIGGAMLKSHLVINDIDCDQRDEFLYLSPGGDVRNFIDLWDENVHVVSWVLNFSNKVHKPFCANLDQEGALEIVVPEKVENSVFLNVYTSERKQLQRFFACEGVDRNNNGEWDGWVNPEVALDLDNDGNLEIITAVRSAHDLYPRGVWAFDWVEGKEIWRFETGAQLADIISADLDGDGSSEIICSTSAPCNGSIANGTDDCHSYLIILDKDGRLLWKKETGEKFSKNSVSLADIDLDGKLEMVMKCNSDPKNESTITILNAKSRTIRRWRTFYSVIRALDIKDITNDGYLDFILLCQNGQLLVLDSQLETVLECNDRQKSAAMLVEDLNNNGKVEVVLSAYNKETVVLDSELKKVLAVFNDGGIPYSVRTNPGQPKRLALMAPDYLYFLDFVKVPPPPYQSYLLVGLTGVLVLFLIFSFRKRYVRPPTHVESDFLEAIPGGLIALDKKGHITLCTQKAQEILALKVTNLVGQHYEDIFRGDERKNILSLIEKSQRESWQGVQEIRMKTGGETKELLISMTTLTDTKARDLGRLIAIDDVTELVWSQRAVAWAKVAQQAAHKIKNPLTMMQLAIDRIQSVSRETFGGEARKLDRYIETNRNQINSLLKITDAFMQIADLKPPNFQPTNINRVIESVANKYAESFSKGITLTLNLNPDLPNVKADEHQMETMFENVITNALVAMGEKGSLSISTGFAQRFQDSGAESAVKEYVQLEISDTGRGIPAEDIDKLFDQFFSRREGGTGMGLAIVKKIVDDHQGHIHVESTVGVGTTFTVLIPLWVSE